MFSAVTPEERLLKLIQSGERAATGFPSWDVRAWAPHVFQYKERARRLVASWLSGRLAPRELNLNLINRGLIVLLALLAVALALNTQRVRPDPMDLVREAQAVSPPSKEEQPLTALRPVDDYLREVEVRDLFNPVVAPVVQPERKRAEAKAEPVKPPEPTKPPEPSALQVLREKAKNLKLVGISWGPFPIAMIEDTATRETAFVKEQQSINQVRVKAIFRDRVVLSYGNAEYDLF